MRGSSRPCSATASRGRAAWRAEEGAMKDLVRYYEDELRQLRGASQHFAAEYPRIAGRLQLGGEMAEDPHVERLVQSFALLAARVHKRLDDDFPLFVESLLQ